jgi:predicted transcriptional regulator
MTAKQSANVFGTFLDTVSSAPSKSVVDLDAVTSQALGWFSKPQPNGPTPKPEGVEGGPIVTLLKAIDAAKQPISIAGIVKSSSLNVDAAAVAIRDALATGLIKDSRSEAGVAYEVTAMGRSLIE